MPAQAMPKEAEPSDGVLQEIIRARIDDVDRQIVELLNRRARHALEMARCKHRAGRAVYAPERERRVLSRLREQSQGPLPAESLEHVFREIISGCRSLQGQLQVAYLGPEYTFSHQAALALFGRSARLAPREAIADLFEAVERGQAQVGLVPVENSSQGAVAEVLDRLAESQLMICGESYLAVSHVLMSQAQDISQVRQVHSHPQALAQCRDWLGRNLAGAAQRAEASTARAARLAAEDPQTAAVGSQALAKALGLNILAEDIQDSGLNTTRFLVLGREDCPACGQDKTSICFITAHQPGSLHRVLACLAQRQLNLTRIESRPVKGRPWEYIFFVDFEGHRLDPEVAAALQEVQGQVEYMRVMGSYPLAVAPRLAAAASVGGG